MEKRITLLKNKLLDLPKRNYAQFTFEEYIEKCASEYIQLYKKIINISENIEKIEYLVISIKKTINQYLNGDVFIAFQTLDKALGIFNDHITTLTEKISFSDNKYGFYRARTFSEHRIIDKEEMFHIPFDQIHNVTNQRYSITGIPCLYLGSSLYICWEELGRPNIENMYASRYKLNTNEELSLFDISYRRCDILKILDKLENISKNVENYIDSHLIMWPLIFSLSISVKNINSPFKPEYIISQLLLQWIKKNRKLDGIMFFSNKISNKNTSKNLCLNFAIPIKNRNKELFCNHLTKKFILTDPISFSLYLNMGNSGIKIPEHIYGNESNLDIIEKSPRHYNRSNFAIIESNLERWKLFQLFEKEK